MDFILDEKPKELMQLNREERAIAKAKQISTLQAQLLDSQAEISKFIMQGLLLTSNDGL